MRDQNNNEIVNQRNNRYAQVNMKNKKKKRSPFMKLLRFIKHILIIFIILLVISMGIAIALVRDKFDKINYKEINVENLGISDEIDNELKNYRNIVLFGVDTRDIKNNDGSRSDAIIIVSINKKTSEVKLVSVYRDTYLKIDDEHGLDKITHAYAYGGPELAIKALNENLDLNIKEYATVNFASVANIVNSLGGLDINIEDYEISQMNKYIKDTSKNTGIKSTQITSPGLQHLDGVQAVTYARIRKTAGGDYKRTERMRTVLKETLNKAKKTNIVKLNDMADTLCENVETNVNSKEITSLIPKAISCNVTTSIGWPYEVKGITLNRWYGVPVNLEKNVRNLHKELFNQENYEPTKQVKEISNLIINNTQIR